ncbi:MAG: PepSY domain-containing protein [Rubrivivax sp.]|nr:PepSY domain-containing protein [Rubrivivax sp.]
MQRRLAAAMLMMGAAMPLAAMAGGRPPANARLLSAIVLELERQGYGPIVEIEFDDGRWEVEAYKDGRKRKLKVDPVDGRILSDRPDD